MAALTLPALVLAGSSTELPMSVLRNADSLARSVAKSLAGDCLVIGLPTGRRIDALVIVVMHEMRGESYTAYSQP